MQDTILALEALLRWDLFGLMIVGISIGIIPGILPGIGGASTIALAIPFTVYLTDLQTLVLLCSLYTGVSYGGSITSILVGIPGGGSNVAVMFDGHLMAKSGRADHALGASLGSVALGHIIGAVFLIFLLAPMAIIAVKFGPAEMVIVISFAVIMIGTLRGKSAAKGILTGLFGMMVGTIGISPYGDERGTLGSIYLLDGLPAIALLVAMFTIPGMVEMCMVPMIERTTGTRSSARALFDGLKAPFRYPFTMGSSALIGLWVGILPAIGGSVGSLTAYNVSRSTSPRGKDFARGTGEEEGIVAAETANGSDEGGALATLFVLGLPGGSTTAAIMGALIIKGWAIGPKLVFNQWEVIRTVNWSMLFQAILLIPVGFVFCYFAGRIVRMKTSLLVPAVGTIMLAGIYTLRGEPIDVMVAVGFGIFAWVMQKTDYPPLNFIIGLLLGPLLEREVMRTYATFSGRWELLLQHPIFLVLTAALLLMFGFVVRSQRKNFVSRRAAHG